MPERYVPQPANEGGSQAITIPGLGGEMDTEILSLVVPATLAVFLDPAMALIDTGKLRKRCFNASTLLVKLIHQRQFLHGSMLLGHTLCHRLSEICAPHMMPSVQLCVTVCCAVAERQS